MRLSLRLCFSAVAMTGHSRRKCHNMEKKKQLEAASQPGAAGGAGAWPPAQTSAAGPAAPAVSESVLAAPSSPSAPSASPAAAPTPTAPATSRRRLDVEPLELLSKLDRHVVAMHAMYPETSVRKSDSGGGAYDSDRSRKQAEAEAAAAMARASGGHREPSSCAQPIHGTRPHAVDSTDSTSWKALNLEPMRANPRLCLPRPGLPKKP